MNVLRFSSTEVPEGRRAHEVKELYASSINNHVEFPTGAPIFVESVVRQLPGVNVVKNSCGPCRVIRERRHVTTDGNDDLLLSIVVDGEMILTPHQGEPAVLRSGDVFLYLNDIPAGRTFTRSTTVFDIGVLRPLVEAAMSKNARGLIRRKIGSTKEPDLGLLLGYITMLIRDNQRLSSTAAAMAATHVQDLVITVLEPRRHAAQGAEDRTVRSARLSVIKAEIAAQVTRSDLSMETIARRHGMSPQYVRSLFRAEGTTFTEFVRTERLKRAYRLLTDERRAEWNIGTIALECGFADLSYFNRLFRRRYGMTPSDVRALGALLRP